MIDAASLVGATVDGYRLDGLLGTGGMGAVYDATDLDLERVVALKMVLGPLAQDEELVRRFEREARAASSIEHPNVARIYAFGRYEGRPYYVMERIEGRTLGELVQAVGALAPERCLDYLGQAVAGLEAALARGIVHRDLKPGNLMVDSGGTLKIVDFGLARRQHGASDLTRSDMILGTPAYMAPEQALAAEVDHRADVYALGATFYHLLSGRPVFAADTPIAVMMKHVNDPPEPLERRNRRVSTGLSLVVETMLAKQPDDRYQTWDELRVDLEALGAGAEPPVASQRKPILFDPTAVPAVTTRPTRRETPDVRSRWIWPVVAALALVAVVVLLLERDRKPATPVEVEAGPAETPLPEAGPGETVTTQQALEELMKRLGQPPTETGYLTVAGISSSLATLRRLGIAAEMSRAESGQLPSSLEELSQRADFTVPARDAWQRRFEYEPKSDGFGYRIASGGPDATLDTPDDLVWEDGKLVRGASDAIPLPPPP